MLTTSQAAKKLRRSLRSVQRACKEHGIGTRFGKSLALTDADVARLRELIPGKVGNPNFGKKMRGLDVAHESAEMLAWNRASDELSSECDWR